MTSTTLVQKITGVYVAYAPRLDVSAYGSCRDEALNNLSNKIRDHKESAKSDDRS